MKKTRFVLLILVCSAAAQPAPKEKIPPAVARAVEANRPGAEIEKLTIETEAGIRFYDFEFKAGRGEMDVAEDGTVLDVATIVDMKDLPPAAAAAIRQAATGARITQLSRSEIRSEIKVEKRKGRLVKLAAPRTVYEAEFEKGGRRGEVQVAPDGAVVEAVKWNK